MSSVKNGSKAKQENLETSYNLTFPRLQWNRIIQNENNQLCLYPGSDLEQAVGALASI